MVWKHRVPFCLITAVILTALIAFLRPRDDSGAFDQSRADRFWVMKAQNSSKYNVLIVGDSRSYRGVSPGEMSKMLRGLRVYNLAFSAGGLNPEIYDLADRMLDKNGKERIIVLGVTPSSVMESTEGNRQYRQEHNRPRSAYLERVYINTCLESFAPFDWESAVRGVVGRRLPAPRYINHYTDDGWVGSDEYPEDSTGELSSYREVMTRFQVKAALMEVLFARTHEWAIKGVAVFGFRPPTSGAMLDLENKMSGFNEQTFIKDFEAAGGTWISVDPAQYHSYDGSHLSESSAIRLSDYIAAQIARNRGRKGKTSTSISMRQQQMPHSA